MEDTDARVVSGLIVRRRCCGKHLSFANIRLNRCREPTVRSIDDEQVKDGISDAATSEPDILDTKVVFRRAYFHGDNFPMKSSDLPYGAHVSMTVVLATPNQDACALLLWQVTSWRMLQDDPKELALRMAKTGDGVLCSTYLQLRADAYFSLNQKQQDRLRPRISNDHHDQDSTVSPHGNPRAKGLRAKIFCRWLMEHMLLVTTDNEQGERVLDVAGGKGQLSIELAAFGIACTVMDPLIRKSHMRLDKEQNPEYLHSSFSQNEDNTLLLEKYTCLVGLHPDECTEDILDMALQSNKKVAIIPCCVFPSLFPLRTLRDGRAVQSYDDFLCYLLEKDDRLQKATLPFDGKNVVIFLA